VCRRRAEAAFGVEHFAGASILFRPQCRGRHGYRAIEETETTRDVARAVRTMLYDLVGPFARPATFLEAPDDRLLLAVDDLYERNPVSPIITKLWEMSLDFKGIFELRNIRVSGQEDPSLPSGVAATCVGNIWLGKVAQKRSCVSGLSPTDMDHLIGNQTSGIGRKETTGTGANETSMIAKELHAILTPLPKNLEPETGRQ
jgi:hypothetical protein